MKKTALFYENKGNYIGDKLAIHSSNVLMVGRTSFKMLFILFALLFSSAIWGDATFLNMPFEARGMSLSNAMTAGAKGAVANRYNPAGLGFAVGSEAELTHTRIGDELVGYNLSAAYPFTEFFGLGISASMLNLVNDFKRVTDFKLTDTDLGVSDFEVGLSGGYKITKSMSVGTTMRYFRFQLGPEVSQSFNSDLGFMYEFQIPFIKKGMNKFAYGAVVKNLGPNYGFYGGGYQQLQPIKVQNGIIYKGYKYIRPSFDVGYSVDDGTSVHFGTEILPAFYISPKLGFQYDRLNGLSFSVGGSLSYGRTYRFNAMMGSELGGNSEFGNTFISVLFQKRDFEARPGPEAINPTEKISLNKISGLYRPNTLVPFKSGFRAEKIQGILIAETREGDFLKRNMKLRRIAIQPEDELFLKKMAREHKSELYLTDRKMALWLNFEKLEGQDQIGWWDAFATIVEGASDFEVLTGQNLESLNQNKNAPLRVEWKLTIKINEKSGGKKEIKTTLVELYTGKLIFAKTFSVYEEDLPFQVWQESSKFYASYLKNIKGFYKYQMVLPKSKI